MNILRLNQFFNMLITFAIVSILLTSCDKDIIQDEPIRQNLSLMEDDLNAKNEKQLETDKTNLRIRCSNFNNLVNQALNNLVITIEDFAANPTVNNRQRIIIQFDYYRLSVLEPCLPARVVVPPFVYTGVATNCTFTPGSCFNGSAAISSLEFFQCHLNNFLTNPSSNAYQNNASNAFDYYIGTLTNCFDVSLNQSLNL